MLKVAGGISDGKKIAPKGMINSRRKLNRKDPRNARIKDEQITSSVASNRSSNDKLNSSNARNSSANGSNNSNSVRISVARVTSSNANSGNSKYNARADGATNRNGSLTRSAGPSNNNSDRIKQDNSPIAGADRPITATIPTGSGSNRECSGNANFNIAIASSSNSVSLSSASASYNSSGDCSVGALSNSIGSVSERTRFVYKTFATTIMVRPIIVTLGKANTTRLINTAPTCCDER